MIYLDNAATTSRKPDEVIEAVSQAMCGLGNAGRGAHDASLSASRSIYEARALLASFFNAEDASRIVFTANATESLNIALFGLLEPGNHVISTVAEHNSVLRPLYALEKRGLELSLLPADCRGVLDYDALSGMLRENTRAIVCTHASNVTGNLTEIGKMRDFASKNGLLLFVDASQTAGVFSIDVQEMGIDILCFTGHKGLLGPQGTGGLYVRKGISLKPLLMGGSGIHSYLREMPEEMPERLEAGTLNGHGILGLCAAIRYLEREGLSRIRHREQELMERFYRGVLALPGVKIYGDFSSMERCAIVSLNIDGFDSSQLSDELSERFGIATRSGAHCAPVMHETLGTVRQGAVRFSFSHFNTEEEIDEAVRAIRAIAYENS